MPFRGGDLMGQTNIPYNENFDSMATYSVPTNWSKSEGSLNVYSLGSPYYSSPNCVRFGGYNITSTIAVLPEFQYQSNTLQISFYHKSGGNNHGTFEIGYVSSNTFYPISTYSASNTTTTYSQETVSLSGAPENARIAFRHSCASSQYWYIDDVSVTLDASSCLTPTSLSCNTTSSTTAYASWTAGGSETEWLLYYSKSSTAPADDVYSGTGVVTDINETSYTLEGLDDYTTYYVWVRAKCDEDDYSDWTDAVNFKTSYIQAIPYNYDFEDSDDIDHWMIRDPQTNTGWSSGTYGVDGSYCFQFNGKIQTICNQYLITPELSGATNGVKVAFKYKWTTTDKKLYVGYSTNCDTESFNWSDALSTTTSYLSYEHIFPSNTKYIAIKCYTNGLGQVYIDDFSITNTVNAFITNGNWNEPTKWSNGTVPSSSDNIIIASTVTIPNSYVAQANNITLAGGSLTIADGGQLILPKTSTGIQATVKKETYAATAKDAKSYYWYAISSAVADPSISSKTNLITETEEPYHYDLYRFNETINTTTPWENYRAHSTGLGANFTTLEKGRGYLYRNASDLSIAMTGEINVADFNYAVTKTGSGALAGFNLIGNPYSHDIYKGAGTAIPNGTDFLRTGFYYMDPTTGKWTTGTDGSTVIKPNEAILVQTDKDGNIAMTNTTASAAKYNNDNIMFKVANSQYSDEAYAWFDKGRGLNKINHRNAEVPMLYINQDGENYAIATMSDDTKTFSLNLKAMTTGKYTLSYKTKGEFSYLHVIDRFTGEDVDMLLEGEYSFVASPIDNDARFIVRLEYTSNYGDTDSSVFAYQNGNDIIVSGEGELQVFDVTGRKVMSAAINSSFETISGLSKGFYIFKLNEKTQKIVVR